MSKGREFLLMRHRIYPLNLSFLHQQQMVRSSHCCQHIPLMTRGMAILAPFSEGGQDADAHFQRMGPELPLKRDGRLHVEMPIPFGPQHCRKQLLSDAASVRWPVALPI